MTQLETLIQTLCPNGVKFVKLGEVAEVGTGKSNGNEAIEDGEFPFFVRSKDIKRLDKYEYNEEAIIIPGEGGIGDIFHYINGKYALHQRVYRIHFLIDEVNVKFAYYYMSTNFKSYIMTKAVSATVTSIRKPMIENFQIPLPPLAVQSEIVRILDKFTLYKSELAAELAARLQQYEYYRDQLLTFDDTVKRLKLGEVGEFIRGNGLQKKDFVDEGFPCIHYGQIHTYYGTFTTKTKSFVANPLYSKLKKAHTGDLIIATTSEDAEGVCKAVAWLGKEDVAVSGDAYIFRHSQNPKYMAYLFQTEQFLKYKKKAATGTKVVRVSGESMAKFEFAIPSLEVQERIVSILDRFDKLCHDIREGLPAEIDLCQKQYEHYRDKLLTFETKG